MLPVLSEGFRKCRSQSLHLQSELIWDRREILVAELLVALEGVMAGEEVELVMDPESAPLVQAEVMRQG